jgi:hypothetical protein
MRKLSISILFLLLAVPAFATTVSYTDKDLFLTKVETPFLFEDFSQYPYTRVTDPPIVRVDDPILITEGNYTAVLTAANSINGLIIGRGFINTNWSNDTLRIDFLGSMPVTAIGGNFWLTYKGNNIPGSATVLLSDGTVITNTSAELNDFLGFTTNGSAITRLELTVQSNDIAFAAHSTVDNLYIGTALSSDDMTIPTPEPSSLMLLPTGICGIGIIIRRKK